MAKNTKNAKKTKSNNKNYKSSSKSTTTKKVDNVNNDKNKIINDTSTEKTPGMKILIFLGVVISCAVILYLMNYFFVQKSYIKINISTDKRMDYISVNNVEKAIVTQKYVSDLNYTMRYDVDTFKVIKYKNQDIFKYLKAEKILVSVEEGNKPQGCSVTYKENYTSCEVNVDARTKIYYFTKNNLTFKVTVKTPENNNYNEDLKQRINFMLDSFTIEK